MPAVYVVVFVKPARHGPCNACRQRESECSEVAQENKQIKWWFIYDVRSGRHRVELLCTSVFFSFKYHFSFSFSFGGIFVLVLTFLYVTVVRLMTTLSKPRIFCCSTIRKTGYTSVHSNTLSSMQNVTVQFQKYPLSQGHLSTVPFSCCQITTQRE